MSDEMRVDDVLAELRREAQFPNSKRWLLNLAADELAALRGALQALVGAVQVVEQSYLDEDCEYVAGYTMESLAAARAVAVAVLTGQEPT